MRGAARPLSRIIPLALAGLLLLAPIAAMSLILSHTGRAWLDRLTIRPQAAIMLPGITMETAPSRKAGLVVTSVRSDSEAASNAIGVGDSIRAIDGKRMFTLDQARHYLQKDKVGTVRLMIVRDHRARVVRLDREGIRHES